MNVRAEVPANGTTHADIKRQENVEANSNPPCDGAQIHRRRHLSKRLAELEVRRSIRPELRAAGAKVLLEA